ncbi:2,4-dienoyl-CoA reductase [Staphylococcus xylosus]|uniref:2,4-dienoyl-CoA reductase n=1 Tax=Staphylococcus xylosus TaxID=1288 RepID=UPI0018C6EE2E|nr:2,4-dienoyl-CoA reductase [Staphylococcus xylosus]
MHMRDKVIIVTGGSSGMGKAMATKFAEEGANVVITGRSLERLEAAKAEMEKFEGQVLCIDMDVRDTERVQYTVDKTIETYGKIDGLVNNAAGNFLCPAEDLSLNGWNSVIDIVLNGTWYCTQAVGKEWIKNGQQGRIINMVATYAWRAGIGVVHSASAKAGVLSMTRTLAVEWGSKYGITVNAIAPGPIDNTGGSGKLSLSEEAKQQTLDSVPLGRMGQPEEIASLAKFLLSEEASYINGACMTMDGGQWLNQNPF